jgi:ABC-type uncharacterized transport system fused permease/ATPase subunit
LRQRLSSSPHGSSLSEDQLTTALRDVGLEPMLERVGGLDAHHDPATELSPQEQQFVALARVLLTQRRFVFIDRVHECLTPQQVDLFYRRLAESSINYLSVGDEKDLGKYHDTVLEIGEDGGWHIHPIGEKAER